MRPEAWQNEEGRGCSLSGGSPGGLDQDLWFPECSSIWACARMANHKEIGNQA